MVKVTAKDDTIAKLIKHPNGKGFKEDLTAEWPDDQFTKRRVRDGDVTVIEEPPPGDARKVGDVSGSPPSPKEPEQTQPHQPQGSATPPPPAPPKKG